MNDLTMYRHIALSVVNHANLEESFADRPKDLDWTQNALSHYISELETELSLAKGAQRIIAATLSDLTH